MSIALKSGRLVELGLLVLLVAVTLYYLEMAMRGKPQPLRSLPAVEAISECVDKAVEEGKPVWPMAGNLAYFSGLYAPMTIAGMNVVRYTSRLAVRKGARVILAVPFNPEALPLLDGIFREVCVTEGKPEAYRREDVRYYGGSEAAFAVGGTRDVAIEGCSAIIIVGTKSSAEDYLMGAALAQGAITIVGTPRWGHQGINVVMGDYPLFCEDVYAVGAITSGDESVMSAQVAGDVIKLVIAVGVIVATILAVAGFPVVKTGGWLFI